MENIQAEIDKCWKPGFHVIQIQMTNFFTQKLYRNSILMWFYAKHKNSNNYNNIEKSEITLNFNNNFINLKSRQKLFFFNQIQRKSFKILQLRGRG